MILKSTLNTRNLSMDIKTYFHFLFHALKLKFNPDHRVPLTLNIQMTSKCCNNCAYCDYDRSVPDLLNPDVFEGLLYEAWLKGARRINLSGGEPLMRDDFADIVKLARNKGFFISVSTSGRFVPERIEALKLVDQVMLSYDGPFEVRKKICGEKCALASQEAIEIFKKESIPFWTTTVLTKTSIPYVEWIIDQARINKSQANFVLYHTQDAPEGEVVFHPSADDNSKRWLVPTATEVRNALRRIIRAKHQGSPVGSSMPFLLNLLNWKDYKNIRSHEQARDYVCLAGRASCEIQPDGVIFACGWAQDESPAANIFDAGFGQAFDSLKKIKKCKSCAASCHLESNLIFSLDPATVLNWVMKLF